MLRRCATAVQRTTRRLCTLPPRAGTANAFRATIAQRCVSMQFAILPSPAVTQAMGAVGVDGVCIDLEHGPIGYKDAMMMVATLQGTSSTPIIRVPSIDPVAVKRALDVGAEGIVFPLAETAADVETAVSALHYPPRGVRGFGPFIASSCHQFALSDAVSRYSANPPLCIVLLETVAAVENIDEIALLEGVDVFQIAQYDLSTALGVSGQFDHPIFLEAERRIEEAVLRRGTSRAALGSVALSKERTGELVQRGYRMVVGFDVHWLKSSLAETQSWVL